jgi:glucuronoarabinoxylan endo-1,4-beta-xylanase
MLRRTLCGVAALLLAASLPGGSALGQANITLTESTKYQTIEGMGAFMSIAPWKVRSGPFYVDVDLDAVGFYDTIIGELGVTMFRTGVESDGFEPSAGTFNRGALSGTISRMKKLMATANRLGEPINFMSSCWSPPGWMKASGSASCTEGAPALNATTCKLSTGMEDDLGRHFAEFVKTIRDSTGKDLYAFSIQNEAAFSEPYESCVYDGPRYRDVLKVVAPLIRAVAPNLRFFGAEHMSWAFPNTFETFLRSDATALGYMHAWAVHGYTNGIQTDTGAYSGSTPTDKVFWMTETSGSGYGSGINDWTGAMSLGQSILSYLRGGRMTLWTWWSLQDICGTAGCEATALSEYCLLANGTPTAKYYVSRHFYRFIRPGARQIQSTSSDAQVEVVAFKHDANNCWTLVLRNTGGAKTVNVSGTNVPATFSMEVSTSTAKRQWTASVSRTGISIPGSSMVTLVSGNYAHVLPVSVEGQSAYHATVCGRFVDGVTAVRIYAADGRLVRTLDRSAVAVGRLIWDRRDAGGARVASGIYQTVIVDRAGNSVPVTSMAAY